MLGNWGTNSKFTATEGEPLKMYHADFDNNGQTETLVATSRNGDYYPIQNLPELATQLVSLKKKYSTNNDFAGKTISEIIGAKSLSKAQELNVTTLESGYLKNEKGSFTLTSGILNHDPIETSIAAATVNGALEGFVTASAQELPRGLRVNLISPTLVTESIAVFGDYFKGYKPVPLAEVAMAYRKSVDGLATGKIIKVGY